MRVLFWVQHLLGTGHLKRAATLARAMADQGLTVTLVSGGPPAPWPLPDRVELVQLPPVRANDQTFSQLLDAQDRPIDEAFQAARRDQLLALLARVAPQVLITELFPFGRGAFRFELLPLLAAAAARQPRPWCLCSVRDILVHKPDPRRYEWMRDLVLEHYDRVLVHGDPRLVPFALTFPLAGALGARVVETGYVVDPDGPTRSTGQDEVLVSAGGGRVGAALLAAAIGARAATRVAGMPWRLVAGPAFDPLRFAALHETLPPGIMLERQRSDFQALMANSLLSVSQAGYNTVVEGLRLGKPMVLVPFETASETEQRVRAERLAGLGLAEVVWESELSSRRLARAIDRALECAAERTMPLDLNGAPASARLVAALAGRAAPERPGGAESGA
jgi:predicted glycosyltransferase